MGRRRRSISVGRLAALAPALGLGAALGLAAPAAAAGPGDPFDLRAVCRDDFDRVCAELGAEATRAEIVHCLASHEPELSPACRVAVGEASEVDDGEPDRDPPPAPRPPRPRYLPPHP